MDIDSSISLLSTKTVVYTDDKP